MESIVAFILAVLALGFVGLPLFKERKQDGLPETDAWAETEADRLLSEKDTALTAIRELEFDHAVGNLSDGDYRDLREKYEKRAIALLKTLDDVAEVEGNGRGRRGGRRDATVGRSRRGERAQELALACLNCGEPYEEGDQFCRACGAELGGYPEEMATCPRCGEAFEEGDIFCGGCGYRLSEPESEFGPAGRALPDGGAARKAELPAPSRQADTHRKRRSGPHRQDRPGGRANR